MKPSALFRGVIGRNEIKVRERQTFHSERVNTMARLSSYQLQEWWKEFSQAVYEKANIDVTRVASKTITLQNGMTRKIR